MLKSFKKFCYDYFKIPEYKSSLRTEFLAGVTNYFTLIYAVMLVPEILIDAFPNAIGSNGEIVKEALVYGNITAGQMLVLRPKASAEYVYIKVSSVTLTFCCNFDVALY